MSHEVLLICVCKHTRSIASFPDSVPLPFVLTLERALKASRESENYIAGLLKYSAYLYTLKGVYKCGSVGTTICTFYLHTLHVNVATRYLTTQIHHSL